MTEHLNHSPEKRDLVGNDHIPRQGLSAPIPSLLPPEALVLLTGYIDALASLSACLDKFWRNLPRSMDDGAGQKGSTRCPYAKLSFLSRRCVFNMAKILREQLLKQPRYAPGLLFGSHDPIITNVSSLQIILENEPTASSTNHQNLAHDSLLEIVLSHDHSLRLNIVDLFATSQDRGILRKTAHISYPRFLSLVGSPVSIIGYPNALLRYGPEPSETFHTAEGSSLETRTHQKNDLQALRVNIQQIFRNLCQLRDEQNTIVELLYMRKSLEETTRMRQTAITVDITKGRSSLYTEGGELVTLGRQQIDAQNARTTHARQLRSATGPQ